MISVPRRGIISPTAAQAYRINRGEIAKSGVIPNNLRFIQETYPLTIVESKSGISEILSEAAGQEVKTLKITGIFQKADDANQNGREYPLDVISEAVGSIQEDINKRGVLGEFDHPTDAKIHLDRVSHVITKLWMEGKYVYGVAEVIDDMPCGKMLATLLKRKCQIGISSRGVGDMEEVVTEGRARFRVQPGYQFVTWDIVGEPSVSEAVMHVMESRNRQAATINSIPTRANRGKNIGGALIREVNGFLKGNVVR